MCLIGDDLAGGACACPGTANKTPHAAAPPATSPVSLLLIERDKTIPCAPSFASPAFLCPSRPIGRLSRPVRLPPASFVGLGRGQGAAPQPGCCWSGTD